MPELSSAVENDTLERAVAFLRRTCFPIEPRKKWPAGGLQQYDLSGNIAQGCRAQSGKALCVWGDAGWGTHVKDGKYHAQHFSDDLVRACVRMMRDWNPQPSPNWVTCVPSLRHPDLVPDFARRLAGALQLPFHRVLEKTDNRPEQKSMANSTQQARNVDGALSVINRPIPNGPVLLIDDMVDSRWTLTICAWLLRSNGSGEVWPMVLSQTGFDE